MIAFAAPWLLLALVLLPILWLLLRAVPPAPVRRRFPGVALLLGLTDDETQADTTPWWLLLLRMLAVAAVIVGLAGPILNPERAVEGSGPLLILADGTWADAPAWPAKRARVEEELGRAERVGRPVAVALLTDLPGGEPVFAPAGAVRRGLAGLEPAPHGPDPEAAAWVEGLEGRFDTLWLSDGLASPGDAALLAALEARGAVRVHEAGRPLTALRPPAVEDGAIRLAATRSVAGPERSVRVLGRGPGPDGVERTLAEADLTFPEGEAEASVDVSLPPEIRNRVARFEVEGARSAGGVQIADDALRRREVALVSGAGDAEALELLSPLHYLREALAPTADVIEGDLADVLPANPDVIVLADVARLPNPVPLEDWVEEGGLLLRFAGPRLAASDVGRSGDDPLMPVRLRAGGRSVGGAMSWGEPKALDAFPEDGPFAGLEVPDEVRVTAQVMAEPGPELADRTLARLADGTPLVTRSELGAGQVVLVHVTANAEWSELPLSGLFVRMLERLAVSAPAGGEAAEDLAGTTWTPSVVLDAGGVPRDAGERPGVPGEVLMEGASAEAPPGLYSGGDRLLALNVIEADTVLEPAAWPARLPVEGPARSRETPLGGWLLAAAVAFLAADAVASLVLMGRLRGAGAAVLGLAVMAPGGAEASTGDVMAGAPMLAATVATTMALVFGAVALARHAARRLGLAMFVLGGAVGVLLPPLIGGMRSAQSFGLPWCSLRPAPDVFRVPDWCGAASAVDWRVVLVAAFLGATVALALAAPTRVGEVRRSRRRSAPFGPAGIRRSARFVRRLMPGKRVAAGTGVGAVGALSLPAGDTPAWAPFAGGNASGPLAALGDWVAGLGLPAWPPTSGANTEGEFVADWLLGGAATSSVALAALLALAFVLRRAAPLLLALGLALPAQAQEDEAVAAAASEVVLAHVLTGDARVDEMARAGLMGLSRTLYRRTSIEPAPPTGVDPETDELSVYPFLYWPLTPDQAIPSREAYDKLNRYLRSGGMILFDTRDAHLPGSGTREAQALQRIALSLDVPPLEVVPQDHVLTRSFYLLQDFPGRHASREVWVEAAPPDAELAEGMPFRNLNDGVTPVVIGGNDWAAAWAEDEFGQPLVPIGRGYAGERQREIALRFGVNLIMHVLTGNYKSDQVHVPALLDRLGQ